jgi:hypothetical protein
LAWRECQLPIEVLSIDLQACSPGNQTPTSEGFLVVTTSLMTASTEALKRRYFDCQALLGYSLDRRIHWLQNQPFWMPVLDASHITVTNSNDCRKFD